MELTRDQALARLQATILEILDAIAAFCDAHAIEWFLDSGTALGALRHDGFIPWDDDADVGMLRGEWERFVALAAETGFMPGFSVHTARDTRGFDGIMAKVYRDGTRFLDRRALGEGFEQGIFVDVFPYDPLFADPRRRRAQLRGARLWTYLLYLHGSGDVEVPHGGALGATERVACALANPLVHAAVTHERALAGFERSIPGPGDAVTDTYAPLPYPLLHPKDTLVPVSRHGFCGRDFPVPADPDAYLTVKYGDWRRLPPVEERKSHLPVLIDFGDGDRYEAEPGLFDGGTGQGAEPEGPEANGTEGPGEGPDEAAGEGALPAGSVRLDGPADLGTSVPDLGAGPRPRVLVMMAAYNGGELVRGQIESILAQEGVAVDLLISDDGSTDGTLELCQSLAADHPTVTVRRNPKNLGCAWNFMEMVLAADPDAHDYFAFADQDDRWRPGKLARAVAVLRATGAALYYGGVQNVDVATGRAEPDISRSFAGAEGDIGACLVMNWALGCTMVFTPALLRRLQDRRPAELPRYHDNWVHEVALATMTTAPDLGTVVMDHLRTGANESGHTRLDRLDLQRLRRAAHFLGQPREHEIAREARQLLACYGNLIHPKMRGTVELVARLDRSLSARWQALTGGQVSVPLKRENLLLKGRILLNYL